MDTETSILCIGDSFYVRVPANMAKYFGLNGKTTARIKDVDNNRAEIIFPAQQGGICIIEENYNSSFSGVLSPVEALRMLAQLVFKCQRCGWCCEHCDPVNLEKSDIIALSEYLKKPLKTIVRKYTRIHETAKITSFKKTAPCKFYNPITKTCRIYPARPIVCRSWPFLSGSVDVDLKASVDVPMECPGAVEAYKTSQRSEKKDYGMNKP